MDKALVLDIPCGYNFVKNKVLGVDYGSDLSQTLDDLLLQSFVVFLTEGNIEVFLDDLGEIAEMDFDAGSDDSVVGDLLSSINPVQTVSCDSGQTHMYIVNPITDEVGKRAILRTLVLCFWSYLRDVVLGFEYDSKVIGSNHLGWLEHLDETHFEKFIKEDFDVDWLLKVMSPDCWHYDNADRVISMENLVK